LKFNVDVALQAIYPEAQQIWQTYTHRGFWKNVKNQRDFFDQLATKWNIQKPEDWVRVTTAMVLKKGGNFINSLYNGSLVRG
jgi:hypothetical protein